MQQKMNTFLKLYGQWLCKNGRVFRDLLATVQVLLKTILCLEI